MGQWYIHQGERTAVKFAADIIVLSHGLVDYFWKTYGRKTVYIPNGVTKPNYIPSKIITEKWGLEKDSYVNAA